LSPEINLLEELVQGLCCRRSVVHGHGSSFPRHLDAAAEMCHVSDVPLRSWFNFVALNITQHPSELDTTQRISCRTQGLHAIQSSCQGAAPAQMSLEVLSQTSCWVLDMLAQDQRRHALCLAYHRAYQQDQISNLSSI